MLLELKLFWINEFQPRDEELLLRPDEVWKMDLHTPKILRDRGRTLEATLAGEAVEVYVKLLQIHLCTSLLTHIPPTALGMLAVPILYSYLLTHVVCCNSVLHYYHLLTVSASHSNALFLSHHCVKHLMAFASWIQCSPVHVRCLEFV